MTGTDTIGGTLSFPALYQWAAALFKSPRSFFRSMQKGGGYGTPLLYLFSWSTASVLIGFVLSLAKARPAGLSRGVQAGALAASPFVGIALAFVAAAVLFVVWHLMGSKEDYQTAFRVWAFIAPVSAVSAVLGIVPFLNLLAFGYTVYLIVAASIETHGLTPERSWAVWGTLGGLLIIFLAVTLIVGTAMRTNPNFAGARAPGNNPFLGTR